MAKFGRGELHLPPGSHISMDEAEFKRVDEVAFQSAARLYTHCSPGTTVSQACKLLEEALAAGREHEAPDADSLTDEEGELSCENESEGEEVVTDVVGKGLSAPAQAATAEEKLAHHTEAEGLPSEVTATCHPTDAGAAAGGLDFLPATPVAPHVGIGAGSRSGSFSDALWAPSLQMLGASEFTFDAFAAAAGPAMRHSRKMDGFVRTVYGKQAADMEGSHGLNEYNGTLHGLAVARSMEGGAVGTRQARWSAWFGALKNIESSVHRGRRRVDRHLSAEQAAQAFWKPTS